MTIRDLRLAKGWTMQQAADASGYSSRQAWQFVESGASLPPLDRAQAIAEALGVSLQQLHEALKETRLQARRRKGNGADGD